MAGFLFLGLWGVAFHLSCVIRSPCNTMTLIYSDFFVRKLNSFLCYYLYILKFSAFSHCNQRVDQLKTIKTTLKKETSFPLFLKGGQSFPNYKEQFPFGQCCGPASPDWSSKKNSFLSYSCVKAITVKQAYVFV